MTQQLDELSNDKLGAYKKAAGADASAADKAGDFKRGNKRFSGIIRATKKQFANDMKKHVSEGRMGELHASISDHMDKHIDHYKKTGGAEHLMHKADQAAAKVSAEHGISHDDAFKHISDHIENKLNEEALVEYEISHDGKGNYRDDEGNEWSANSKNAPHRTSFGRRHTIQTHEPHAVHINGKKWKSFGSQAHAQNVANKIKGATVHKEEVEQIVEYGDTAKGQKMLTKVHKRAVNRLIKADDKNMQEPDYTKRDLKTVRKHQATADRAWDRMSEEVAANNVGGGEIAGTQGDAGKKAVMTKEPLKRKKLTDFKEYVELEEKGLWDNIHAKRKRIKNGSGERMRKPGEKGAPTDADFKAASESVEVLEYAVDAKGHKSSTGGLTQKGRDAYNAKGGNLKPPVTTPPSKLDPDSKAAKRRKSFCARMGGMKKRLTSSKTANDPDSRINKALRKWNC